MPPRFSAASTPTILVFGIIDPTYQIMVAIGKQVRSLHIAFVIAPLVIVSYLIGLPYGPKGVALAYSIAMTLWVVPHVFWCVHGTTISPRELFFTLWRPSPPECWQQRSRLSCKPPRERSILSF